MPSPTRIRTANFDPFEFTYILLGLKHRHTSVLLLIGLTITAAMTIVTLAEGTFGSADDVRLVEDVQRIFLLERNTSSPASFPLMRDSYSWFQAATIISGILLLHRQWQHMATCLSSLSESGAIVAPIHVKSNWISRMLLIDRLIAGVPPEKALDVFVTKLMNNLRRASIPLSLVMLFAAIVFARLLLLGQEQGVFQVLSPDQLTGISRDRWLSDAYASWWAGTNHVIGHVLYNVLAVYAMLLILHFQIVGLIAVYVIAATYFLVEPSADWLNRDGRFGWSPVSRTYRTVIWGNVLLALTLINVIIFLGVHNYTWILGLLGLYIIVVPLYIIVPWLVFRRVQTRAIEIRVLEVEAAISSRRLDPHTDFEALGPFTTELERCQRMNIQPLRFRTVPWLSFVVLVLLPVFLAAAQIFSQLRFGGS